MRGHIRRRGKDSWQVVVSQGFDPQTGKRRQARRSVKGTKRDAETLLTRLLAQFDEGIDLPSGRLKLGDYLTQWWQSYAQEHTAPKTSRRYEELIRLHLTPTLGHVALTKLRPLDIQRAYTTLRERGLSGRTALQAHRVLREALHHAVRWGLLPTNPAASVAAPRAERYEPPTLDPDDVGRLLAAADQTEHGALIHTLLYTGLRVSEVTGLRWQDVSLERSVLHVRQVCHWLPRQGFVFGEPKSYRSRRPVALDPLTVDRLRRHRAEQAEQRLAAGPAYDLAAHDLVFADPIGSPLLPSTIRASWKRIRHETGLTTLRLHDLRHAHASFLVALGADARLVSERLGHATPAFTLATYVHPLANAQAEAAARFADWLRQASG